MRVSQEQLNIITPTIQSHYHDALIYLFGSRVDSKRGGDIDIFVQTSARVGLNQKIDLLREFERKGIERKVDLVIKTPFSGKETIYNEVIEKGVRLC